MKRKPLHNFLEAQEYMYLLLQAVNKNAKELTDLGHGLFTYVLINALSGKADGAPNDGKITVYELKSYLDDQVPELNQQYSTKPQYPYTFSRGHDFPIVME